MDERLSLSGIEKAAEAVYEYSSDVDNLTQWAGLSNQAKEVWRTAMYHAAPHLQYERRESAAQEPQMPTKQDYDIQGPFAIPFAKQPTPAEDVGRPESTCVECNRRIPSGQRQKCEKGGYCNWYVPASVRNYMDRITAKAREGWVPQSKYEKEHAAYKALDAVIDEEGIARSYINPIEDLRIAIRGLKQQLAGTVTLDAVEKAFRAVVIGWVGSGNIDRVWKDVRARLTQQEPTEQERNYHFEDTDVLEAVQNSEYAKDQIRQHLELMNFDQKWSLYRAVVKIAALKGGK